MLLFGCHPFLTPADMTLGKSEQMVKLIENTVKGQLQIPVAAVGSPVSDLLHRILVPAPKQRYTIKDITMHPWFMVSADVIKDITMKPWFMVSAGVIKRITMKHRVHGECFCVCLT
jgi:serine/threonine protein kinase